jgi:hypothetical protein
MKMLLIEEAALYARCGANPWDLSEINGIPFEKSRDRIYPRR